MVLNVILTGGTRGLGLGIARNLTAADYSVIAIARQHSEQLASAMRAVEHEQRGSLQFRPFDLGNVSEILGLVRELRNEFGAIYGLVNGERPSGHIAQCPD